MGNKEAVGLIPVYIKPGMPESGRLISAYDDTLGVLKEIVSRVVVINDGSRPEDIKDATIIIGNNCGKAEAIREGLRVIEHDLKGSVSYIIQTDADLDQDPHDASLILNYFVENIISPDEPVLVVGDRYLQGQADNSPHRQGMLIFQRAFSLVLGFDVRDPVSGFRGYTKEFAKKFLELSKAEKYGVEIEQMVIAFLIDAKVVTIPLSYSRLRASTTLSSKFLDSINAILNHSVSLKKKGLENFVDFYERMKKLMELKTGKFTLDMKEIGTDSILEFNLIDGSKYSVTVV